MITGALAVVHLNDLDLLLREVQDQAGRTRLRKLGFEIDDVARLESARAKLAATVDPRWMHLYERARKRYGRGVVAVRSRVCMGCYVTLPTTARPQALQEGVLSMCESCSRILHWG